MKKSLFGALALCLALIGCNEVRLTDGKLPAEFIAPAKQYAGNYTGQFDKIPGILSFNIADDGYVSVLFNGSSDLLGGRCESQIGKIYSITPSKDGKTLKAISIYFDPGKCARSVVGRWLDLKINDDGAISARIVETERYEPQFTECYVRDRYGRILGSVPCHTMPGYWVPNTYLTGEFHR